MIRQQVLAFISPLDGWLSSHEGFFLYEAAQRKQIKGEIVEIGSWMGKSTICLAAGTMSIKGEKITAIDPHEGKFSGKDGIGKKAPTFTTFIKNLKKANVVSYVTPLVATSQKAAILWKKPIKLLFIDGLHDYKHTFQDYSLWSPFVVTNGIVAFHDAFCGHMGPEKVIFESILQTNSYRDIGVVGSIIYVQKGYPENFLQQLNILRHRLLLPVAARLHASSLPYFITFFLVHRIIKLLLLNRYTLQLQMI